MTYIKWNFNDGGRSRTGFKGQTGDCVCRAIAIATGQDYGVVYEALIEQKEGLRQTRRVKGSHPRTGVNKRVYDAYLKKLGWKWTACMQIGSGCKVHLIHNELPSGTIIARVSKHVVCVIDGVLQDIYDCSRGGTRCVYGYYSKEVI